jgi:galactonate dehydratase
LKIKNLHVYRVAAGDLDPVLLELETDEGLHGFGEAAIAYGCGSRAAAGMLADFAPRLAGRDPARVREIWQDLYDHSFWAKGGGAIVGAALSAVDQALWDLHGQVLGRPVHELLGGPLWDSVPVYANGWNHEHDDVDRWARAAERPLADGYTRLKCYPFAHENPDGSLRHVSRRMLDPGLFQRAVRRVRALREVTGPDVELMLDLSGGLAGDQLFRFLDACADLDIAWIEEPLDPFDHQGLAAVAARCPIPIAVGERLYTRAGFRNAMAGGGVAVVMPDAGTCGGIFEGVLIAGMAEAANARLSPHNCGSSLGTAAALTLCAAAASTMCLEVYPYLADAPGHVQVLEDPPESRIRHGRLEVNHRPGLGVSVDRRSLAPFRVWDYLGSLA